MPESFSFFYQCYCVGAPPAMLGLRVWCIVNWANSEGGGSGILTSVNGNKRVSQDTELLLWFYTTEIYIYILYSRAHIHVQL